MKVIRKEDIKAVGAERKRVREGSLETVTLSRGTPGTAGNYMFAMGNTQSDYGTPRHRHNFEQIRFQYRGEFDYSRDGKMTEGMVGYYPEGTFYGPSQSGDNSTIVILQFGGASGSGYMSHDEYAEGLKRLAERGTFHDGVYTWVDANGKKHNKDGYEAVWEESRQRELVYPKPRFEHPVFMRPENFAWKPSMGESGVAVKHLGSFGEREVKTGFVRIDAGATAKKLAGDCLYFVASGSGVAGATAATGERWHKDSCLHISKGESAEVRADEAALLFYIAFPDLSGIEAPSHQRSEAALPA